MLYPAQNNLPSLILWIILSILCLVETLPTSIPIIWTFTTLDLSRVDLHYTDLPLYLSVNHCSANISPTVQGTDYAMAPLWSACWDCQKDPWLTWFEQELTLSSLPIMIGSPLTQISSSEPEIWRVALPHLYLSSGPSLQLIWAVLTFITLAFYYMYR